MILLAHIIIALASVAWASVTFIKPTHKKIKASYGLIAATVASGTALVIVDSSAMLHTCIAGLVYVVTISAVTIAAQVKLHKLELVKVRTDK